MTRSLGSRPVRCCELRYRARFRQAPRAKCRRPTGEFYVLLNLVRLTSRVINGEAFTVKSGGGAGASGGFTFQHRVAAWLATRMLGEASLGLQEIEESIPTFLQCEAGQPVDDIVLHTRADGYVFLQAKGGALRLSQNAASELGKAIAQFVAQYRAGRVGGAPLEPRRDRLVLAVGPACSQAIALSLPKVVHRIRGQPGEGPLTNFATSNEERKAISAVLEHVNRCWRSLTGADPSNDEIRRLLSLVEVRSFALEPGGADEQTAKDLLRTGVLEDPGQADGAWDRLVASCAQFTADDWAATRCASKRYWAKPGFDYGRPPAIGRT